MRPEVGTKQRQRRFQRQGLLRDLGYRSYGEYLRSPHWKRVRRRYRSSDLPQDCMCGETEGVQLHHTTYERIGNEKLSDLTPLCPSCHAMIHELERRGEIGLDFSGFVSQHRAVRHAMDRQGFVARQESYADLRAEDEAKRQDRSIVNRLRETRIRARRKGIDISSEMAEIEDALSRAQDKLT